MPAAGCDADTNDIAALNGFFADLIELSLGLGRHQLDAFGFGGLLVCRAYVTVVGPFPVFIQGGVVGDAFFEEVECQLKRTPFFIRQR